MAGRYLLDTNIVTAYLTNQPSVVTGVDQADEVFLPSIVLGELYFGVFKSGQVERTLARVQGFITDIPVLVCDLDTARVYGELKNILRSRGLPIPDNDLWIAAIARQHGLVLATRDAHFGRIADLRTVYW